MMTNKLRNIILGIFTVILTGILVIFTQNTKNQTLPDSKETDEIIRKQKESYEMFHKTSSTAVPVDAGNSITAIRRIVVVYEEADQKKKMDLVEIELLTKWSIPISDANTEFVFIGEKVFMSPIISGGKIFVRMKPEEFNEIKDNALVHLATMPPLLEKLQASLTTVYKDGEPKEVTGAKFGRINKRIIYQFPVIEEDLESLNKRISEVKQQPE